MKKTREELQSYREKQPLGSTRLEKLLPLLCIPHGEGDWIDTVLELGRDCTRPLV